MPVILLIGIAIGAPLGAWLAWLCRSRAPAEYRAAVEALAHDATRALGLATIQAAGAPAIEALRVDLLQSLHRAGAAVERVDPRGPW